MSNFLNMLMANWIPILIVALAVTIVLSVKFIASRYKKVPPNAVGIFYGRKYRDSHGNLLGFKVLAGGGRILMPLVESFQTMTTAAFQIDIDESDIPNKDNVKMNVRGVATVKVSTVPEDLNKAVGAFLGKQDHEIVSIIQNILKGHLRSIVGKMDIDGLLRQRDLFNKQVVEESTVELKSLGIEVINLVITDITDTLGYIDALGKRAVAQTKAEAEIKVAEAERDQNIKVAQANRDKDIEVSNAQREAAKVKAENEAQIAEAAKNRDILQAQYKTEADTKKAEAEKAFDIATAAQDETLQVAEAKRDAAAKEAQVAVQEKEKKRKEKELEATVVTEAEANKRKIQIEAEAARQRIEIEAEAAKRKKQLEAEAEAGALTTTADARKMALTAEGEGEAAKRQAVLMAEAVGQAAAKKEALLAEAEGTKQLAEALRQLSNDGKLILILDKLPGLIAANGNAQSQIASAVFTGLAAPLGQIDKINIVDLGGSGKGVESIADIVPNMLTKMAARGAATGMDMTDLLKFFKLDPSGVMKMVSGIEDGVNGSLNGSDAGQQLSTE